MIRAASLLIPDCGVTPPATARSPGWQLTVTLCCDPAPIETGAPSRTMTLVAPGAPASPLSPGGPCSPGRPCGPGDPAGSWPALKSLASSDRSLTLDEV